MSLPLLLLVDDSDAVLAYEKAALSGLYTFCTASNGKEAWNKLQEVRPAAVLLDLSMPEMSGDELLVKMKQEPSFDEIPVIVISSEKERSRACLELGATASLPKPIRADELRAAVARVLDEASARVRTRSFALLFVSVGPWELGIPLDAIRTVLLQPATAPLSGGPPYLSEFLNLHGRPICVVDLARLLRVPHQQSVTERKVVVIRVGELELGLCVDQVRDPEELRPEDVVARSELLGSDPQLISEALSAAARLPRGIRPVIDPSALLNRKLLAQLPSLMRELERARAFHPEPVA